MTDNCEIAAKVPEVLFGLPNFGAANNGTWQPLSFCHPETGWLTQVKLLGSYPEWQGEQVVAPFDRPPLASIGGLSSDAERASLIRARTSLADGA